jgi:hypothetical protein
MKFKTQISGDFLTYPRTFAISVTELLRNNNGLRSRYKTGYKNEPIFAFPFEVFPFKPSYYKLIC